MALVEDIIGSLNQKDSEVRDVVIGPSWTLVASLGCGVARNIKSTSPYHPGSLDQIREKCLGDLFELALSKNTWETSIGIAALNSAIASQLDPAGFRPYRIPRARNRTVALVGDFPFAEDLRQIADEVLLIEEPESAAGALEEDCAALLGRADIAILPASAIVSHALESLLRLSASAYTIVFGPSTPLSPVLFRYGANQLVGIKVQDEASAKQFISQKEGNLAECPGLTPVVLSHPQQSR